MCVGLTHPWAFSLAGGIRLGNGAVLDLITVLILAVYIAAAVFSLSRHPLAARARLLAAEGAVMCIAFTLTGTLLQSLALPFGTPVLQFLVVLTVRPLVAEFFAGPKERLRSRARV
jgi:hypothetical protein